MHDHFKLPEYIDLALFDGAAGAGAGAGGEGAGTQGETQASPVSTRRGKSGETQQVLYGKQAKPAAAGAGAAGTDSPPAAGESNKGEGEPAPSTTVEDRQKAYREMIEGEFKDIYTADVQHIIDRRFKETGELRTHAQQSQPILDILMGYYGVTTLDQLRKAVEGDDTYIAQAAEEAGMTTDQMRMLQGLKRENAELLAAQRRQQGEAQYQGWLQQGEALKELYPSFDINAESQNPRFVAMLKSGVSVKESYEVMHIDDIKAGVAAMQAQATERQIVSDIKARGARPAENGTTAQSAFTVKDDVSKLTKKDRAEIARRAARGEHIEF